MSTRLLFLIALALPQQSTPTGGAITKYVPPVPTPASFVSDLRKVLKPAERDALDARIRGVQGAGLGDIAVAIVPSIGGYDPQQVGVEIYRTWKVGSVAAIGSARRNVGVLILIVPKELAPDNRGHCFIVTGTGAEGIITDATAGTICRDSVIPRLRTRDYAGAIGSGISGIESRLRGDSTLANSTATGQQVPLRSASSTTDLKSSSSKAVVGASALASLILLVVGAQKWRRHHRRKCPRCARRMRRLDEASDDAKLKREERIEEELGSVDYDVWACECGECTVLPYRSMFSKYSDCRTCRRRAAASKRNVLHAATRMSSGRARDVFNCKACGATWAVEIILPQLPDPSTSSSHGSGGGGGSSFGGSGSTSGGGGGGSY